MLTIDSTFLYTWSEYSKNLSTASEQLSYLEYKMFQYGRTESFWENPRLLDLASSKASEL